MTPRFRIMSARISARIRLTWINLRDETKER